MKLRTIIGIGLLLLSLALWYFPSDIVKLIITQRPILLGKFSQGHFAVLLLLTPMLWVAAGFCLSKQALDGKALSNLGLILVSSIGSIIAVAWLSKLVVDPRFVEEQISQVEAGPTLPTDGVIRHRPPNQLYQYTEIDQPKQVRSYPNPPPGYKPVEITLTSDTNGYRNREVLDQYDMLVIGDSFAAGSHVSDEQAWPVLLAQDSQQTIYNLGVSGTDIQDYFNGLVAKGLQYKPKVVILMVYEGNDFKRPPGPVLQAQSGGGFIAGLKDSPAVAALRHFSRSVLEQVNSQDALPEYPQSLAWMPIKLSNGEGDAQYYSFHPKRAVYLNMTQAQFSKSDTWEASAHLLNRFKEAAESHGFKLVIAYAPSKPHVVMPSIEHDLDADGFRQFLSYKKKNLPDAQTLKTAFYDNIGSQEAVVEAFCDAQGIGFVSLTSNLQEKTEAGIQTYYTYDQHWTPDGNQVAANTIYNYLKESNLLAVDDMPMTNVAPGETN